MTSQKNDSTATNARKQSLLPYVVLGLSLLVLAIPAIGALRESLHVSRLESLSAEVSYGPKGGYFVTPDPKADVAELLKGAAPSLDFLSRRSMTTLKLDATSVSDSDLRPLESVRGSIIVSLKDTAVTDAGLEHLRRVPRLAGLDISGTDVSRKALLAFWKAKWPGVEPPPEDAAD
jgi:hypothetical protein